MRTYTLALFLWASCLLSAQEVPDLVIDTSYVTIPENAIAHPYLTAAQHFLVRVRNDGGSTAQDFTVGFTIRNTSSSSNDLYSAEVVVEELLAGEAVDVLINEEPFFYYESISMTWPVTYEIAYRIGTVDGEIIVDNNEYAVTWQSDPNYLAKETGATTSIDFTETGTHYMGACFYLPMSTVEHYYYAAFEVHNVLDLIENTIIEGRVTVLFYESMGDSNADGLLDSTECTLIYFNDIILTQEDEDRLVLVPVDLDEQFPELLAERYYLLFIEYTLKEPGEQFRIAASDVYDYTATATVSTELATPQYANVYRFIPLGEPNPPWNHIPMELNKFGTDTVPVIRLASFDVGVSTEDLRKLPPEYKVQIGPNPVSNQLTIYFDFPEEQEVQLELYNTASQLVQQLRGEKVYKNELTLDCSQLASGAYLLRVLSTKGEVGKIISVHH